MTIEIIGRSDMMKRAYYKIDISVDRFSRKPLLSITGASLDQRDDRFFIKSRHMTAVDVEHDSAYVAWLEGAGRLEFTGMLGRTLHFRGVIIEAKFYTGAVPLDVSGCPDCEDNPDHGWLKFTPPLITKWQPRLYEIEMRPVDDE